MGVAEAPLLERGHGNHKLDSKNDTLAMKMAHAMIIKGSLESILLPFVREDRHLGFDGLFPDIICEFSISPSASSSP
jgi:hypothetical protein